MTQDRIPLDAGSSRPAMEGETNELDARGLRYAETAVHFAGDDADAKALAEAGGEVMWPFKRKQTPRNVDFWQLPKFWQGYIEGQDEMLATYSDDISRLRAEIEQLRRERDAQRTRQEERVRVLEEALRPFNIIAGELFARNFNRKDKVYSIQGISPDGFPVELSLLFEAFLNARAALGNGGGDA